MYFDGVTMYPRSLPRPRRITTVGLWTHLQISERERLAILGVFRYHVKRINCCAIIEKPGGTSIQIVLKFNSEAEARIAATFISSVVRKVTGIDTILRELPTSDLIRQATS